MATLINNQFIPGKFNNYLIAGNVCNAFTLGELGSQDDFFLVGAEPNDESSYPLLTGNVLDSEGNVLFRLVRNKLALNPGDCSKILGDHIGYEIHDSSGILIFRIRTSFESLPGTAVKSFVTTLTGTFYDKNGNLVFSANSGEEDERIEAIAKFSLGFSGGFGMVHGMSEEEIFFASTVLHSRGAVHELIKGNINNEEITLDGKALINARLTNCKIHVHTGDFSILGASGFERCEFVFHDTAENIKNLVTALIKQS